MLLLALIHNILTNRKIISGRREYVTISYHTFYTFFFSHDPVSNQVNTSVASAPFSTSGMWCRGLTGHAHVTLDPTSRCSSTAAVENIQQRRSNLPLSVQVLCSPPPIAELPTLDASSGQLFWQVHVP